MPQPDHMSGAEEVCRRLAALFRPLARAQSRWPALEATDRMGLLVAVEPEVVGPFVFPPEAVFDGFGKRSASSRKTRPARGIVVDVVEDVRPGGLAATTKPWCSLSAIGSLGVLPVARTIVSAESFQPWL